MDKFDQLYNDVKAISFDDISSLPKEHQSEIAEAIDQLEFLIRTSKGIKTIPRNIRPSNDSVLMIEREIFSS